VSPDELLGDGILGNLAELVEEGPTFEVDVEAVTEAQLLLALEGVGLCAEREFYGTTALFVAREHLLAYLLGETEGQKAVLDLLLLCSNVLKRLLVLVYFHYFYKFIIILIACNAFFIIHIIKKKLIKYARESVRTYLTSPKSNCKYPLDPTSLE
jgi:hypothetical protein